MSPPCHSFLKPVRIPIELVERIIDYLHDDHRTLSTFCLVSKTFLASCRYHLWQRIKFSHASEFSRFNRVPFHSPNSPVFRYITHMEMCLKRNPPERKWSGTFREDDAEWACFVLTRTIVYLEAFRSIRTLQFSHFSTLQVPDDLIDRLFRAYPNVTTLALSDVTFQSSSQFTKLIANLPKLRSLTLNGTIGWPRMNETAINLPMTIRELKIDMDIKNAYLKQLLAAPIGLRSITTLHVTRVLAERAHLVGALIQAIGPLLEELLIGYIGVTAHDEDEESISSRSAIDLTSHSRLRKVIFQDSRIRKKETITFRWISDLLLQINSSKLEAIEMELPLLTADILSQCDLKRAMPWMTRQRFPALWKVTIWASDKGLEGPGRLYLKEWDIARILWFKYLL